MRWSFRHARDRPVNAVPLAVKLLLALSLGLQVAWQSRAPEPVARATALPELPSEAWLRVMSLGEPVVLSQLLVLYLQAFDNQPGISIPYADLDYTTVKSWLGAALSLDPEGQYPLLMATHLYARVPDEGRRRQMLEFVHQHVRQDPHRRWRWLAHAAIIARHQLNDLPLALRYGEEIAQRAPTAPSWARQMRIFLLADMGEREAAAVLLGGLLESGEVTDSAEITFLTGRLKELKENEKPSMSPDSRQ